LYHIGFVLEQTLGHITHTKNLQRNVPRDPDVKAYWGLPAWETHGLSSHIPLYKSNWTIQAGLQTRRLLSSINRQTDLDGLFFHTQVPATLATSWLKRYPSIISLDATPKQYDSLGEFYAHSRGPKWLENWKWRLNRNCFLAADHLVTWSEWAKDGLVSEYQVPPEKITVIPPGVDLDEWSLSGRDRRRSNGAVKILFVGGNLERKGGFLLLEAFRSLRQESLAGTQGETAGVELHLVTRDPVSPEPGLYVYNDLEPNSGRLKDLYHASDIFCLPTYGDCLPMVLSEAAAAALPSISTQVAAIPEIVRDGQTGFLAPAGDGASLTAALRRLIADPDLRQRLGAQALELIRRSYDAGRNTARLLELLKQTIDERRTEDRHAGL
jgi:glycosyltransferase involved in cell wall biosynthesis